nr:tetratricopeptide repeat protein [Luteimonas aestuarii]
MALPAWAQPAPDDPLRDDVLGATMAGEYAAQAGRLDEAIDWYLAAARASGDDIALAAHATRLALLGNDDRRAAQALALWQARAPRTLDMQAAQAALAIRNGRVRDARRTLETMLQDPSGAGWRFLGPVLAAARDPAVSARVLRQLVASGSVPDSLPAWLSLGEMAQRLDQPALADEIGARIVQRFPGEPRVALLRARQLRLAGDIDGARAILVDTRDAARLVPELRYAIAMEYEALDEPLSAEQVLAEGPQDPRTQALRASLLAQGEDKDALGALYEELKRGAGDPNPMQRLLLGQVAEYLEHHGEALDWYQSVPGGDQRWQARLRATRMLHKLERGDEAYAALRALQNDASAIEEFRRVAYLMEAELRAEDGDVEGEYDAYTRGLAAWPDEPSLLYSRALMWERRDDIPRAEADLRMILVADPENVAALNALGYTLADRTTRYEEALELIDRARIAEPDNAAIIDSYGWVLYRLGRKEEALVHLRRAYTMQKDAEIAAHVAEVLWELGRRDEARKYFDEARKLDPDNRSLLRALANTGA